jgi:hypothetical protein
LEVEPAAVGLNLSILAIQVWMRENKAPMVRLSYVDGTDNCDFVQLVEKIRAHGVSHPSYLLTSSPRDSDLTFLTVCNCDVGKQGPTAPRAAWQSPPLCCIPGKRDPETTDVPTAAEGPHSTAQRKRSEEGKLSEKAKAKVPTKAEAVFRDSDNVKVL